MKFLKKTMNTIVCLLAFSTTAVATDVTTTLTASSPKFTILDDDDTNNDKDYVPLDLGDNDDCTMREGLHYYEAITFVAENTASHDLNTTAFIQSSDEATNDNFLAVYKGVFNPQNPEENLIGCNDDYKEYLAGFTTDLNSSETYTAVFTSFYSYTRGDGTATGDEYEMIGDGNFTISPDVTLVYVVGGTISGLDGEKSIVLQNSGGDNLTLGANGSFAFDTALNDGANYNVSVLTNPVGKKCTVTNPTGTIGGFNINDISVTCVDNTPPTASNFSVTINEDTNKTFGATEATAINFQDVDNDAFDSIYITTLPTKGRLTLSDVDVTQDQKLIPSQVGSLKYIPLANGNGTPYDSFKFKVNDGESNSTSQYTATINVTAVEDAPTLEAIADKLSLEDADDLNITLNAVDVDDDNITYTVTSSDPSKVTVSIVDGKLVVTQIDNANGEVTIEVNATANGQSVLQSFDLNIEAINDAPTFDTNLTSLNILEDAGVLNYEINVTDVDGDELNITIESNNTDILKVSKSWNSLLNGTQYVATPLEYNLTTVKDANGIVTITVTVDDRNLSASSSYIVGVTAVNDAPTLSSLSDMIQYKNFDDINVTLPEKDVDGDILTYSVTAIDTSIVDLNTTNNIVTLKSKEGISGKTDVNITVNDHEYSVSKKFNLQILSFEDDDDVEEQGTVEQNTDENGTKNTTITVPDDNLTLKTEVDTNGTVSHEIKINGKITQASSDINGSKVEVTSKGVSTTYDNEAGITLEVNATVTGEATHNLTQKGKTTKATSKLPGTQTKIEKDTNGKIQIKTSVEYSGSDILVVASEDGKASHTVTKDGKESKAASNLEGASTVIDSSGEVQTTAGEVDDNNGFYIKAEVVTKSDGTSITRFIKVSQADDTNRTVISNTMKSTTPYTIGNKVTIDEIGTKLFIKTVAPLGDDLEVE